MTLPTPSMLNSGLKITILSLLMASVLSGCGIRGSLKTPPPLFGAESKVDPQRVPTDDLDKDDGEEDYDTLDDDDFDSVDEDPLADF